MGSKKTEYVHIPRVASFTVKSEKGVKIFTPVNKRAKKLALKAGKRTRLTGSDLKKFDGYYKLQAYTSAGTLKNIKL